MSVQRTPTYLGSRETLPFENRAPRANLSGDRARLLYAGATGFLLVLMFLGFQQFYLHGRAFPGRELTPPIRTLLILHGIAMTTWMLLVLAQSFLIVAGHRRVHMRIGRAGAVLAAGMVLLGWRVGIESARVNPPDLRLWGLAPKQFMAVPIIAILTFAVFVGVGIWNRRRPAVHRPMMLLAVLAVMPAATDRIDALTALYRSSVWGALFGPFFTMVVVGLVFLIVARLLTRVWDRWFALGYAALVGTGALTMAVAPTPVWDNVASFLLR